MQSPTELMQEEEDRLLGGIWQTLRNSAQSGRLDAAGLAQSEIDGLTDDLFRTIAAVVHGAYVKATESL